MIQRALLMLVLVCSIAASARAQCCGDCNGDGTVTINELITAVNNALAGCGGATPTAGRTPTTTHRPTATRTPTPHCPLALNANGGSGVCDFNGTYNRGCGSALSSVLATNGTAVTVIIATMLPSPTAVYFGAQVASATSANLIGWSTDAFQTVHPTAGVIQLNDGGSQLIVFPNDPPFMIQGCNFVEYIGAYTGNAATFAAPDALPRDQEQGAGLARLRAWLERPIPDLAGP